MTPVSLVENILDARFRRSDPRFNMAKPNLRIGLALGSGAARGVAHIGVIRELDRMGIQPDIVTGCSIGALMGGAYAVGRLGAMEEWLLTLNWLQIVRFMDIKLSGGGFMQGEKLLNFFRTHVVDVPIEQLGRPFGCVATDLVSGREVWLQKGSLLEAVRASMALPGLLTPARYGDRWLVDGGLVNPVPVSLCRAMGAEVIIAVNLNGDIVGKHMQELPAPEKEEKEEEKQLGMFTVLTESINIMQDRVTRSRMAGDPPEIVIAPRLAHLGMLEFDRAAEAVEEGAAATLRMKPAILDYISGAS